MQSTISERTLVIALLGYYLSETIERQTPSEKALFQSLVLAGILSASSSAEINQ